MLFVYSYRAIYRIFPQYFENYLPILQGIEDVDIMSKSIRDCQENIHKLNTTTRNLTEDGMKKQRSIDVSFSAPIFISYLFSF